MQLSPPQDRKELPQFEYSVVYSPFQKEPSSSWLQDKSKGLKDFKEANPPEGYLLKRNLQRILSIYKVGDLSQVVVYLIKNLGLVPLLIEAHDEIRKLFESEKLQLRISIDPDNSSWKLLVLSILVKPDDVDEAISKLDQLDNNWLTKNHSASHANLCINLDFE